MSSSTGSDPMKPLESMGARRTAVLAAGASRAVADRALRAAREWLRAPRAWVCLFLCAASVAAFVVIAKAHAWLCDDAFISFRYSDNIVSGFGAVFNRGERVEGYTNFLWVLELAAMKWATGIRLPVGSEVLSVTYTVLTILLAIALAARPSRAESARREWAVVATMAFLLTERGFGVWTTSGLETRQFTFFVLFGLALIGEWGDHRAGRVLGSVAFGLAELTRPEGLMLAVVGIGGFFLERLLSRRWSFRAFLEVAAPAVLMVGLHFVWRYWYYGDWLPNTYYAKHVRPWWDMGARYIGTFAIESGAYLLLPLAVFGAALRFRRARFGFLAYGLVAIVAECQYIAQIGGDHFEFRPFDFFWVPLSVGAGEAVVWVGHAVGRRTRPWAGAAVGTVLFVTALAHGRVLEHAQWRVAHTRLDRDSTIGMVVHVHPEVTPEAYVLPTVKALLPIYDEWLTALARRSIGLRHQEHKIFYRIMHGAYGAYHRYDDGHRMPPDTVMAHGNIGAVSYGLRSVTIIDHFGLTDRTIARNPVTRPNEYRVMAHDRGPPPGYLEARGVNIWIEAFATSLEQARYAEYVLELAPGAAYMPFRSAKKAWVKSAFAGMAVWGDFFAPGPAEQTELWEGNAKWRGHRVLGSFDGAAKSAAADAGLEGWQAIQLNGVRPVVSGPQGSQRPIEGQVGAGLLDSFGADLKDEATGAWVSPPFTPERGDSLLFLVAGGASDGVGVSLQSGGETVATYRGRNDERLRPVRVDLAPYEGKPLTLRVFDDARGGWGHVIADHFVLARAVHGGP